MSFWEVMKEEAEKLAGGRKIESRINFQEDNDIRALQEKRKILKKKKQTNKSNTDKVEYAEVKKTFRKKRRTRALQRRK